MCIFNLNSFFIEDWYVFKRFKSAHQLWCHQHELELHYSLSLKTEMSRASWCLISTIPRIWNPKTFPLLSFTPGSQGYTIWSASLGPEYRRPMQIAYTLYQYRWTATGLERGESDGSRYQVSPRRWWSASVVHWFRSFKPWYSERWFLKAISELASHECFRSSEVFF